MQTAKSPNPRVRVLRGRSCVVLVIVLTAVLGARAVVAATFSGTVHYGGSLGPVSATKPIGLFISSQSDLGGDQIISEVHANDGPFSVDLNPGTYYLAVFLDLDNFGFPLVGVPYQIYNHRFALPADPITVPATGVSGFTLTFDDTHLLSGFLGTMTYTGHLGQVSRNSRLEVFAYTDPDLTTWAGLESNSKTNGGPYEIITLDMNSYYLLAFFDQNGNGMPDAGEPFEIYNGEGALPADIVVAGPAQTDISFTFGDEHLLPVPASGATSTPPQSATPSPTPTATPTNLPVPTPTLTASHTSTPSPTPTASATRARTPLPTPLPGPCVGDCNRDGKLSTAELVTGVDIALGLLPISICPGFACAQDGHVTVDCVVEAVSAAVYGCRQTSAE